MTSHPHRPHPPRPRPYRSAERLPDQGTSAQDNHEGSSRRGRPGRDAGDTGGTAPVSARQMMRAIAQAGYGSADVLHLAEIGRPAAAGGEVLLRVHAAGLDRGTWHLMAGQPYVIRLVSGLRAPKNPVPGLDVAGTVVAAGGDVTGFAVGEEVFGIGQGSFAEYARPPGQARPQAGQPHLRPGRAHRVRRAGAG